MLALRFGSASQVNHLPNIGFDCWEKMTNKLLKQFGVPVEGLRDFGELVVYLAQFLHHVVVEGRGDRDVGRVHVPFRYPKQLG